MKTKAEGGGFAKFLAGIVAVVKPKKAPLSEDQLDAIAYVERVNLRAERKRAENAAIVDELFGRPRWIPFTRGWLGSRAEREAERERLHNNGW